MRTASAKTLVSMRSTFSHMAMTNTLMTRAWRLASIAAFSIALAGSRAGGQSVAASPVHKPQPTSAAITVEDLKTREYIIADDSMEGRDTGTRGGLRGATYIAGQLKQLGLEPAGDNGTFLQRIPWVRRVADTNATLKVADQLLRMGTDYLIVQRLGPQILMRGGAFGSPFNEESARTVYGGTLGDSTLLAPELAKGRIVVFDAPPAMAGRAVWNRLNLREYAQAKAVIIGSLVPSSYPSMREPREVYWDSLAPGPRSVTLLVVTPDVVSAIFRGSAARTMRDEGLPMSGHIAYITSATEAPTYNVVGIVRGSDPSRRNTYVAVGAHHDHVGFADVAADHDSIRAFNTLLRPMGQDEPAPRTVTADQLQRVRLLADSLHAVHGGRRLDSIMNGADDDGSGTVLGLELAEALSKSSARPARSVLFVFHAAEERGAYGSEYFTDHPTVPRDSIVAQVNMDQMGRGGPEDASPSGQNALVVLGAGRLSKQLGTIADSINQRSAYGFRFDHSFDQPGHPSQGWCRSDHWEYARYNIPVLFFVSDVWYQDYHMVTDEAQYINYPRLAKVGQYVLEVVQTIANLRQRPPLDQRPYTPYSDCVQ